MPTAEDHPGAQQEMGVRLRSERKRIGLNQGMACEEFAVSKTTQSNYEQGLRSPDAVYLAAAHRLGIDVLYVISGTRREESGAAVTLAQAGASSWLVSNEDAREWRRLPAPASIDTTESGGRSRPGTGPLGSVGAVLPHIGATAVRPLVLSLPKGDVGGQDSIRYQVIPRRVRPAAAGSSSPGTGGQDVVDMAGDMAFSFEWLRRNLQHSVGLLTSSKVSGDSMAPTLLDGETIIIDEGVQKVDVDGIYVLDVYGRRLVKRVQHFVDGSLVLISDNQAYQRETIGRDMARDVMVIGRMVWPRLR